MASPAVAAPQANGVAGLSRPDSPASINSSTKRKRDATDDIDPELSGRGPNKPAINGVHRPSDQKPLIHDFFSVLQSLDTGSSGLLKRPLPDCFTDVEPTAKRTKSEETSKPTSIADKMAQESYGILDDLVSDVAQAANARIKELESAAPEENPVANDEAIASVLAFRTKAIDLYRRELAYPDLPKPSKAGSQNGLPPNATGGLVLSTVGAAPTVRPLFTSRQRPLGPDGVFKAVDDTLLPNGVIATQVLPFSETASSEKAARTLTLGELYPSPKLMPPLQPPKAPKTATKGNVLTFYHPELTEKSKYRSNTYFSQNISAGQWLDYSNATPTTHPKAKQRERAQSLAGHKPSSTELEISEMEALFRGAFTGFAPPKDDSAAIVPSSQVGRIWWQRSGQRYFEKLVTSETADEDGDEAAIADPVELADFDEERIKGAIDTWDEWAVDPSLDEALGKRTAEEKDVDDLLEEVSEMIETLASYQRNRNLTLPTSQDRYSADPVNGDMLRNGSLSHQPSEEEILTYQTLKAQLSLIINTLPPYAVARLNSDKLEELNVSTKIEVRTDEYKGVMEEDEPARLARQAAQAAANTSQRQHRVSSASSASPYPPQQYASHFTPGVRPLANSQHFPQTPSRPQVPNMYPQRPPSTVPNPQPQHLNHQRQPPPTQYRPQQNPYSYAPQLAKAQTPYGHSNMPPYAGTPPQPRMAQLPNYQQGQPGMPTRYQQQGYQGYPQQLQPQHAQHPQHPQLAQHPQHSPLPQHTQHHMPLPQQGPQHPQHPQHQQPQQQGYLPYVNGGQMPRNMSPQVPQAHGYSQSPTPPQQHQQAPRPQYGTPGMPPNQMPRSPYHGGSHQSIIPGSQSLSGYATVMPEVQQRQVMEQAQARAEARSKVSAHMEKAQAQGVVGLAGIGLQGTYDINKIAAAKMQMGGGMSPSPKMMMQNGPSPVNGGGIPPPSPSPLSMQHGIPGQHMAQGQAQGPYGHAQAQAQAQMQRPGPSPLPGQGYNPPAQV